MGKLSVFCLVVVLIVSVIIVVNHYQINRDIEGWKVRAQVSSEPNDMLQWMTNAKKGMENRGMVSGYAALIFRTPENDMSLIYHTVEQHVIQAEVLTKMNRSSPEYQTGLDNLRGSIRELTLETYYFWGVHAGMIWWILLVIGLFGFVFFFLMWSSS